jgi:hypothetical protein
MDIKLIDFGVAKKYDLTEEEFTPELKSEFSEYS